MKAGLIVAAVLMFGMHSANAQNLTELAQFAESICGDIPKGELTKTNIQGKIGANVGLVAKVLSGNAELAASKAREIYEGIPFDKLPDNIPTVSMCKLELIKVLRSTSTPQKQNYQERRRDLRTLPSYFASAGLYEVLDKKDGCQFYLSYQTREIYVDDKMMRIRGGRHQGYSCTKNAPRYQPWYDLTEDTECSAKISDLDDILDIPHRQKMRALNSPC